MSLSNRQLLSVITVLREQHPKLLLSQLEMLLRVATKPGQTQSELAHNADLSVSAVSRAVRTLGNKGRRDKNSSVAMDWIEATSTDEDDRIRQVFLTHKGQELMALIHEAIDLTA